jgi:ribosome-binding factor A
MTILRLIRINVAQYYKNLTYSARIPPILFLSTESHSKKCISTQSSDAASRNGRSIRQLRVADSVYDALIACIYTEDMFMGHLERDWVDIQRIEMSPDLHYAKVYWLPNETVSATKVSSLSNEIQSCHYIKQIYCSSLI